jgi:hypothetical protein
MGQSPSRRSSPSFSVASVTSVVQERLPHCARNDMKAIVGGQFAVRSRNQAVSMRRETVGTRSLQKLDAYASGLQPAASSPWKRNVPTLDARESPCPRGFAAFAHCAAEMLIFVQHIGFVKRLFMEVRPPAVAAVRDSQQQRIGPIPRMQWGFYDFPSGRFQVRGVKCEAIEAGAPRSRIERCRAGTPHPRSGRGQALRRVKACKTNPISLRRRRAPEAKCAERTQFGLPRAADGGDCAKRSQT